MIRYIHKKINCLILLAILLFVIGVPTYTVLQNTYTAVNDKSCLIDPYVEYQNTLPPGEKPSIKINFSLNPNCSDVTGYKVYTTYNLFNGKYNNYVKRYYVLTGGKSFERNNCVHPSRNSNDQCKLYDEGGTAVSCYTWDDIKDKEVKYKQHKYVIKQRLNTETCEFESVNGEEHDYCYYFKDELIGDFGIKPESHYQEAAISNLEFNTTYQIKIALIRGNKEGKKITIDNNVLIYPSLNNGVQNFNKQASNNQIPREQAYRSYFSKAVFKKNSKLISPTRFNNESTPYPKGNTAAILRLEDVLYRNFGYDIYYSDIGRGYDDATPPMVQPEELFIYKNCQLDLEVLSDTYNGDNKVYIICNETDPKIIELIKRRNVVNGLGNCEELNNNSLRCLSPDYGVSIALLAKAKPTKLSVSVNRADKPSTATSLNVSMLLLQNGFYKNEPYPLGIHLRKIVTDIIVAYIKGITVSDLRNNLTNRKDGLSKSSLKNFKNYKEFQENIILRVYDKAIAATKENGQNLPVSINFIKKYFNKIFTYVETLCNGSLSSSYCSGIDVTGAVNSLYEISPKLKTAFLKPYDENNKKWKWNLYAENVVLEKMADFELYQINLLKDFISPKSTVSSIVNGGELFSYTPTELPLYDGKDEKNDHKYSYYDSTGYDSIGTKCKENPTWCGEREKWYTDLSENFRRQQRVLTDKFSSALSDTPFKKPYIYYFSGQQYPIDTRRNSDYCLYAEITGGAFDLICAEKYLTQKNKRGMYLSNISLKNKRNKYFNLNNEYFNHFFSTYESSLYLPLNGAMYGYLKLGYMTDSIGWCVYYHTISFKREPTLTDLPAAMNDTLAVSKVAAEFSYLDDFLKNSEILTINNQEVDDQYNFSSDDDAFTVVRKEYGKQHWLVLGVSRDFVTRDSIVNIDNNPIDIVASPAGNLYEIAFVSKSGEILWDGNLNGELKLRLIDDAKTFSLMSEADESLISMKQFGDFKLPDDVDPEPTTKPTDIPTVDPTAKPTAKPTTKPTTTPTPSPTQNIKCKNVTFSKIKKGILDSTYTDFVLSQVKKSKTKRKKQLKNAKKLINAFYDDAIHLPGIARVCPNQKNTNFPKYEAYLKDAKLRLEEIYNLSAKAIRQQKKKKRKMNNRKNNEYYNEKLSLINSFLSNLKKKNS